MITFLKSVETYTSEEKLSLIYWLIDCTNMVYIDGPVGRYFGSEGLRMGFVFFQLSLIYWFHKYSCLVYGWCILQWLCFAVLVLYVHMCVVSFWFSQLTNGIVVCFWITSDPQFLINFFHFRVVGFACCPLQFSRFDSDTILKLQRE